MTPHYRCHSGRQHCQRLQVRVAADPCLAFEPLQQASNRTAACLHTLAHLLGHLCRHIVVKEEQDCDEGGGDECRCDPPRLQLPHALRRGVNGVRRGAQRRSLAMQPQQVCAWGYHPATASQTGSLQSQPNRPTARAYITCGKHTADTTAAAGLQA